MNVENKTILITGANRGIGRALVEEALKRGAKRVYAATRQPFTHSDGRVTPLTLDVTNSAQIQDAVEKVEALDILINNAGVDLHNDLSERANLERHLAVNLFGTYGVSQTFLPLLARSQGAVVNVLSLAALASVPFTPAYSISKAAAFSLTQSLRAFWTARGVKVHAVMAGPVDTDMTRYLDIPKFSAESVARGRLGGLEKGDEDIFPDPMSESIAEGWRSGATKALERQFAAYMPQSEAKATLSGDTNDWDSMRRLKAKGARMRKILTASVILALLFSITASAQNEKTRRLEPLPRDLEIQLALSALPPHLRDNATVYVLNPDKGFEVARKGTNGFHAFVARTGDDTFRGSWPLKQYRDDILYPISFDEAGAKAQMQVFFDAAEMQAKGTPPEELKKIIQERYKTNYYKAPERAGVSYMLSPILRTYTNPDQNEDAATANFPHVMYYAP